MNKIQHPLIRAFVFAFVFAFALLLSVLLCSCGDSHLAKETTPYRPFVVIVPDRYSGDLEQIPILSAIYAEKNQSLKMYVGLIGGDKQYFGDDASIFLKNILWDIDGKKINLPSFKYTLERSGQIKGSLRIVDLWDDTVHQEFDFFVNEPNAIAIDFPYDGYNQVHPLNLQSLPLRWTVSGIDPWETATCDIFAYTQKDSLWDHPIGTVDCFDKASISGSLVGSDLVLTRDSSFTFYWAVRAAFHSEYSVTTYDTTEIAKFSTKTLDSLSTIKIPFTYDNLLYNEVPRTQVSIIAANGDTLSSANFFDLEQTVVKKMHAQSGVKVYVRSMNRSDYMPESLVVDVPEGTVLELAPIHLRDKVKPQVAFVSNSDNTLHFHLYDDGSGLNEGKIYVTVNQDTVRHSYSTPWLSFDIDEGLKEYQVFINAEDYSKNTLSNIYWNVKHNSSTYTVEGPFVSEGN